MLRYILFICCISILTGAVGVVYASSIDDTPAVDGSAAFSNEEQLFQLFALREELSALEEVIRKDTQLRSRAQVSTQTTEADDGPREVPFFSQFDDISYPSWRKVGCGVAGLAMLIEYYEPGVTTVDTLLGKGIDTGAYLDHAGWTHNGLVNLARGYGLTGAPHDYGPKSMDIAFAALAGALDEGPVMASVYYTFEFGNPIPHLVVVNDIVDDTVYYNDPAEPEGGGSISVEDFKTAWKKRFIEIRPAT